GRSHSQSRLGNRAVRVGWGLDHRSDDAGRRHVPTASRAWSRGLDRLAGRSAALGARHLRREHMVVQHHRRPGVRHAPPLVPVRCRARRSTRRARPDLVGRKLGGRYLGPRRVNRLKAQPETPGAASVIIVDDGDAEDTCTAVAALRDLHWPRDRLETIVVDNASNEASRERIAKEDPGVRVGPLEEDLGSAAACNAGAQSATGEYLACLHADTRAEPGWISEAVGALDRDGSLACVASKVLDWDGQLVDFVDAAVGFYGRELKVHRGEPDSPAYDRQADVLFASNAAMVVRASIF